jgi:hypothetical protein
VGDKIVEDMDRLEDLKIALTTWATWIDHNIDPQILKYSSKELLSFISSNFPFT